MDITVFQIIWIASGLVLFVGWLVVSFTQPGARRTIIEWVSASAMYVALLTLFISIGLDAQASGSTVLLVAMGLLCVIFGGGLIVSLGKAIMALGGGEHSEDSSPH